MGLTYTELLHRNIEAFQHTRNYSNNELSEQTAKLIDNTKVIVDGSIYLKDCIKKTQRIGVAQSDTVNYLIHNNNCKTAVLSFADALEVGGLVLQGEPTQEEHLCRCSNLYESISKKDCIEQYYCYNYNNYRDTYTDRLIYSKGVTFFKDEDYELCDSVVADVITCPAPLGNVATEDTLIRRIKCIIGSAYHNGVSQLILGAWGCGAFGCNSYTVARAFKKVLDDYSIFNKVVFVIKETPLVSDDNYKVFKEVLLDGE